MRKLNGLDGAAFDKAYVQNEIAYHRTVNDALSGTLIPGAHHPELKSLLETGLTLFREHQKHAEHLAQSVSCWRGPGSFRSQSTHRPPWLRSIGRAHV